MFSGPNRKLSEKYGMKVYLCGESCHRNGVFAVHRNAKVNLNVKKIAQERWEELYGTREDFRKIFGKSYL